MFGSDEGDNCLDCWGFTVGVWFHIPIIPVSSSSFRITFGCPCPFQFDLMFDTLFVSAHRIFSYETFTQGTFGFNIFVFGSVLPSFFHSILWHIVLLPLCVVPCISFCFPNIYCIAYIHLCNSLTVERLYI